MTGAPRPVMQGLDPVVGQLYVDPVHRNGGTVTLVLWGSVDRFTAPILRKRFAMGLTARPTLIEVDVRRARVGDDGIAVLAEVRACAKRAGVALTLVNAGRRTIEALNGTRDALPGAAGGPGEFGP